MAEPKAKTTELSIVSSVRTVVAKMIECNAINIPNDYSPENAITMAWMVIKETKAGKDQGYKPAIQVCTTESIKECMYRTVTEGLSPLKDQCYFIIRKDKLTYQRSGSGSVALAKRFSGVKRVDAQVVFKDDEVEFDITDGIMTVISHKRGSDRSHAGIKGAYVVITESDGTKVATEMSMSEIESAWSQGDLYGKFKDTVHTKFKDQMILKTAKTRACKPYITTSDDSSILYKNSSRYTPVSSINNSEDQKQEKQVINIQAESIANEEEKTVEKQVDDKSSEAPKASGRKF